MSIKKYLFSFLLVFSVSAFAQSWQSKPVVRIEDAGQSFLYTFNDSSNAYINKCNVSYIVNLPNSQWVQVGYQYDGSTSRIITASYSAIIQPDLGSAKELSDTLNAWLRDCASASGIPSGLADSLSDIRKYVDSLVFFYPDSSTITQYDVINSLNTPPGSPVTGDTYLVGNSPTGAWVGHAKDIAEWNGSAWVFTDAVQGDFLYNATNLFTYIFRNGNWVQTSGIPALNNGNTISSGLKIGTDNARSLTFETNNVNRGRIDSIGRFHIYNLPTSATADSFVILGNTLGNFTKQGKSTFLDGIGGGGGGGVALSDITAATAADTINNAAFQQEWKWDSLSSGIGLKLSSSSTKAASNTQTIFGVYQSGANNTSTQTTYGAIFSNSKTGTLSTNIGGRFVASGANNNYAIEADNQIKVVNSGTGVRSISFWSSSGENARIGCGYNNAGYDHLEINNLATTGYTSIVFKTKNTEVARINDLGYFHIGSTANPSYPLQIDAVSAGFSVVTSHRILCNSETELGFTTVNNGGIAHFGSVSGANTAVISTGGTARMYITSTNVGIGTSSTPDASALLDLSSTTKGLSLPTMTATQASAIASPKKSLMIYVTDTNGTFTSAGWWGYNGTTWKLILAQ